MTTKGRYALRAIIALAKLYEKNTLVSVNTLSEEEDISSLFLEQIFFKLKKAGIVKSIRGPGGGFLFNRPLDSISIREVLDAAGEELTVLPCDRQVSECDRISDCIAHKVIISLTDKINSYLEGITLQMLLENPEWQCKSLKKKNKKQRTVNSEQ
ncbi:MAG: Rrf2 family transcriptional regulator [Treponema sp.]|nr:Rrf2 family transcriptional regulator [Treponema sp.]